MTTSAHTNGEHINGEHTNGESFVTPPAYTKCDVAIAGFGPVGIVLSALLAQRGLKVVAVEKHPNRYHLSRAGHIDGEIMRIFQRLGVATDLELRAQTVGSYGFLTADLEPLQRIVTGEDGSGWKRDYLCPSTEIEEVVVARALQLGVQVYMGVTAEAYTQKGDRALMTVRATKNPDAPANIIDAAFVIGADGANSFLRSAIGSKRIDQGFTPWDNLVVDFQHNDPDRDFPILKQNYQILDARRPQLAGRWGGNRYSRFEFARMPGETREQLEEEDTAWQLLSKWELTPKDGHFVRRTIYTFESYMTDQWRVGRAILVGDAAHTMPPFMGQGMCSGLRDAMNLSWKLDAVMKGAASEDFLDTYQLERGPHVQTFIEMSIRVGNLVLTTDPEKARVRDEMLKAGTLPPPPPFPRLRSGIVQSEPDATDTEGRPSFQGRVAFHRRVGRLDDFLHHGWKIVSRHLVSKDMFDARQLKLIESLSIDFAHVSRGAQLDSDSYYDIDGGYDEWFESTGRKAFLQRPDNYVFGTTKTIEDIPSLLDVLENSLGKGGWNTPISEVRPENAVP